MIFNLRRRFSTNSNLNILNDVCVGQMKIKPIELHSGNIQIIKDPIDFYLSINKMISAATRRVALSSLYLGTGSLQRYLIHNLTKRMQVAPRLQTRLLFDYHRSQRIQKGESGLDIIKSMHSQLPSSAKPRLRAGYLKSRNPNHLVSSLPSISPTFSEILGVHHMKIYISDDDVIITGANLSHSYFTYRQDRYLYFRDAQGLADYAYDLVEVLVDGSARINEEGMLKEDKNDNLENYFKMWRFGFKSNQKVQVEEKAQKVVRTQQKKEEKLQETSIIKQQQQKKQDLRERQMMLKFRLAKSPDQGNVSLILNKLKMEQKSDQVIPLGQKVYIFPVTQVNMIEDSCDKTLLKQIFEKNVQMGSNINISSGYMNFPKFIVDILKKSKVSIPILTSSPQANSFYEGGRFKRYIPYFYRTYQRRLLKNAPLSAKIMEYIRWGWTFHTKGIWITEPSGAVLTIIGSSNFNMRSYERDTEFQVYIYSTCPDFNERLREQWNHLEKACKQVKLKDIEDDKDVKLGWFVRGMSWIFSRFM